MRVSQVVCPFVRENSQVALHLKLALLPAQIHDPYPLLLDLRRDDAIPPDGTAAIQLVEGTEYRYLIVGVDSQEAAVLEPAELFQADDALGHSGRFRPGLATGRVEVRVKEPRTEDGATLVLEVRSRKLDYLSDYRWMMRDLAGVAGEILMERFAASESRFSPDDRADARTLYERFEFVHSLLQSEEIVAALHEITRRPYVSWDELTEAREIRRGVRATSATVRELVKPGPRVAWSGLPGLPSIPRTFAQRRTEASFDNAPNRFVKATLTGWRAICVAVEDCLTREDVTHPVRRGLAKVRADISRLDEILEQELFKAIGWSDHVPTNNQVLQKRAGYRDVFRAFLQVQLSAKLSWTGGGEVYFAGQRNVATLYEFWVFVQIAGIVATLSGCELDQSALISLDETGVGLSLRRGRALVLSGVVERLGRRLQIELWFNRTFGRSSRSAWSRPIRPDVSLRITATDAPRFSDVWIHFDAKYRVDNLRQILGDDFVALGAEEQSAGEQAVITVGARARSEDLMKMHAYRDAIRKSAGAYVVYPGDESEQLCEYHELLPGLGAFGLRPTIGGEARGGTELREFLDDVLTHSANQLTQDERVRFWLRTSTEGPPPHRGSVKVAEFLKRPAADTAVLLGYVRSDAHFEWIRRTRLYNLRADNRRGAVGLASQELGCELVVLYGRVEEPEVWAISGEPLVVSRAAMLARGYPDPRGDVYFCLPIDARVGWTTEFGFANRSVMEFVDTLRGDRPVGTPIATTWLALMNSR